MPSQRKKGKKQVTCHFHGGEWSVANEVMDATGESLTEVVKRMIRKPESDILERQKSERRHHKANFWLDEEDRNILKGLSKETGLNMNDVIRVLLLDDAKRKGII